MHKSFALATGLLLVLSGCKGTSPTWRKVVATSHAVGDAEDRPRAYAGELHRVLTEAAVPHKVVTFEFAYNSKYDPFAKAQRTAVIYQDSASIKHPWWIMDRTLDRPVWLPTGSVEHQVSFYVRRPANVLEVNDYAGFDDKTIHADEPARRLSGKTRIEPVSVQPAHAQPVAPPAKRRSLFAPRAPQAEAPAAPKKAATSSIQPATGSKPVHFESEKPAKKAPEPVPAEAKKAATKPAPKPVKGEPVEADAKPAKNSKKPAKPKAKDTPKAAAIQQNKPEAFEEPELQEPTPAPLPVEKRGPRTALATPAVPRPGAKTKAVPLITEPVDKPKDSAPDQPPKPKPKFRGPLIDAPSAEAEKPGLLRRIFSGLNPRRLFTRA